jgi:hypothetical protein
MLNNRRNILIEARRCLTLILLFASVGLALALRTQRSIGYIISASGTTPNCIIGGVGGCTNPGLGCSYTSTNGLEFQIYQWDSSQSRYYPVRN